MFSSATESSKFAQCSSKIRQYVKLSSRYAIHLMSLSPSRNSLTYRWKQWGALVKP